MSVWKTLVALFKKNINSTMASTWSLISGVRCIRATHTVTRQPWMLTYYEMQKEVCLYSGDNKQAVVLCHVNNINQDLVPTLVKIKQSEFSIQRNIYAQIRSSNLSSKTQCFLYDSLLTTPCIDATFNKPNITNNTFESIVNLLSQFS